MAVTTYNAVAEYDSTFYSDVMIESTTEKLLHSIPMDKAKLPQMNGKTINWQEFENLSTTDALTALTEGVSPSIGSYSVREVTATIAQYGASLGITDIVDMTKRHKHGVQIVKNQAYQAAVVADTLDRNQVVSAATNDYYGTAAGTLGTTKANTAAPIDGVMLDKIHTNMQNNNAEYFYEVQAGSSTVGSTPVDPCYLAIVHPSVLYTLYGVNGFDRVSTYGGKKLPGEVGVYNNFRFIASTNAYWETAAVSGASAPVYFTAFFAPHAAATVELDGMSLQTYYDPPGSGEDHARQRAIYTWKMSRVSAILNNARMAVLGTTIESI